MNRFDEAYTRALKGKTIESVEVRLYSDAVIKFTDGTSCRIDASGVPSTILFTPLPHNQPRPLYQRVKK